MSCMRVDVDDVMGGDRMYSVILDSDDWWAIAPPESPSDPDPWATGPKGEERTMSGIEALAAWRAAGGVAGPRKNPLEKAAENPKSLRLAITAKCYDCVGQDADPNWRARVGTCGCTSCPLHAVRPYQHLSAAGEGGEDPDDEFEPGTCDPDVSAGEEGHIPSGVTA